ncbi:hypothetical protein KIPE111705_16040 [Kibdelosporangium persicum]|uniref:SRPBCC family protein n=1 Tax=Kibdelosporangium persicum TaxID=2698649 RepID=A0ABX2F171_9PSEU|nr:hypothetical protein [Kibdelosporangium persicum]NRN65066.1 hypothetical protein [Kibdelosporangium persicum]
MTATTDLAEQFERAWTNPRNTAIDLPPVDVNQILRDHYEVDGDLRYTRTMLWDMEVRKASRPDLFLPNVVQPGSAEKWATADPDVFTRVSAQRLWLKPEEFGVVIEHVQLDQAKQSAYFIGVAEYDTPDGRHLVADTRQPLFHVEHWVEGAEDQPVNRWRIVHETDGPDQVLTDFFTDMGRTVRLRDFIEVHIRDVLGHKITPR